MDMHGTDSFETSARRLVQRYADTILQSDVDGCMALWDDGATQMPPDTPMVRGKAAIREGFRAAFQRVSYERFDIELKEIRHSGEYGFALGNYTYSVRQKAGGAGATREGKFLTLFRQQSDGSWKVYVDCFNLNARPS
jgi:uncharacterized protein (TIGR02246 family)